MFLYGVQSNFHYKALDFRFLMTDEWTQGEEAEENEKVNENDIDITVW